MTMLRRTLKYVLIISIGLIFLTINPLAQENTPINHIAIFDVQKPQVGESPILTASVAPSDQYRMLGVYWIDESNEDNRFMKSTDVFEALKSYGIFVELEAAPGYSLVDTEITINGRIAEKLIHRDDLVDAYVYFSTEDVDYVFIDGANQNYTKESNQPLALVIAGDFNKFKGVSINNSSLDTNDYQAVAGSTIVRIMPQVLDALPEGTHKITVLFTDGEAETTVIIKAAEIVEDEVIEVVDTEVDSETDTKEPIQSKVPNTAISQGILIYLASIISSLILIIILKNKSKNTVHQ